MGHPLRAPCRALVASTFLLACSSSALVESSPPLRGRPEEGDASSLADAPSTYRDGGVRPPLDLAHEGGAVVRIPYVPADINHILSTGQSLATGYGGVATSLTQPFKNVMLGHGVATSIAFGQPFIPLVEGPSYETISSALANHVAWRALTDDVLSHAILVSIHGGGGTPYSGLKKGTDFYQRGMDQVTGARSRALTNGQSYVVRCVTSIHGETDTLEHNTHYESAIIQWQEDYETDVRALTGQAAAVPMLHSQNSANAGSTIPLDMLNAHIHAPGKVVLVGPKYHIPYVEGVHLTTDGYRHLGEDYAKVYKRIVIDGLPWEPLRPGTITRDGATITISFLVPAPPLVIDTTLVEVAPGFGFVYSDASGASPSVVNVAITAPDTVVITLSSAPVGAGKIRYAYWDQLGNYGPRGNLRDSDATPSRFGYALYNWSVQFEEDVP